MLIAYNKLPNNRIITCHYTMSVILIVIQVAEKLQILNIISHIHISDVIKNSESLASDYLI